MSTPIESYWKDDFTPLQAAGKVILQALRQDEAAPDADLYRRLTSGSHLYIPEQKDEPIVKMRHLRSIPLPSLLQQELSATKAHVLMGLLAQAQLAWMTVDSKLFLWSIKANHSFCSFQVNSGQHIVSVGLVRPKPGVFRPTVEWCVIVTTPEEVILCALARSDAAAATGLGETSWQLVPTQYTLPTDGVRMLSIAGTEKGRIFLGGEDGCVYEMNYEPMVQTQRNIQQQLEEFYHQGADVSPVLTEPNGRKRHRRDYGTPPRKCRKINRSSNVSAVASAVIPDFIINATAFLFGGKTSTGGGRIVQMVMDQERHCLYTLSNKGWICTFNVENEVKLLAVVNAPKSCRLYLEDVSRGKMYPQSTRFSSNLADLMFPGGGPSAQAGVGGMEGARAILKHTDLQRNDHLLLPVSIHVVPRSESSRITLVAVTRGGLRMYFSSLHRNVFSSGSGTYIKPSTQLILCHVRAPPPFASQESFVSMDVAGGLLPRVESKPLRVDASSYENGVFVAAIENNESRDVGGDMILAAYPDSVARKEVRKEDANVDSTKVITAPGGITEILAMPMSSMRGTSANEASGILPGGIVWDMSSLSDKDDAALRLFLNSQTPTEGELDIGFPPAYMPPSKVRPQTASILASQTNNGPKRGVNETALTTGPSQGAVAMLGNLLTNVILQRPLRYGFKLQKSLPRLEGDFPDSGHPNYELSRRDASEGFSNTAAEGSSRSHALSTPTKYNPKSARLRSWLLKPAVVPLNQLAKQHLLGENEMVALNAGGLHFFCFDSILSSLAEALAAGGEDVPSDSNISKFFTSYGYKEGCAMCLALVVGCGPAAGDSEYSKLIRRRASIAAMSRAYVPTLVPEPRRDGTNGSSSAATTTSKDPLVPPGYEFKPSAVFEGLAAVVSRLLRPVFYKPCVVVTEGRIIQSHWYTDTKSTPAKVELLMSDKTMHEILPCIRNLLVLIRSNFARAVENVPGLSQNKSNSMDVDEENARNGFLTRALQYHIHIHTGSGGELDRLTPRDGEQLAHLIEEKNIHSIYRLVARVVQLLDLMTLLRRAHDMTEMREVDWGMLHGLTVSQLVETTEGQDRLESLLNALLTASVAENRAMVVPSAQVDQLAKSFADRCYLFFSPASRFAYLGIYKAAEALSYPISSSWRISLANEASANFRSAAQHWHSAPLITGRILHTKGQESYDQIATRARQSASPLARAVDALIQLEDVATAVEICLITASNFKSDHSFRRNKSELLGTHIAGDKFAFPWEQDLYHKRREFEQRNGSATIKFSPSTPSTQNSAYGTSVTATDAVDTCYALIFNCLSSLLNTRRDLADRMLSACVAAKDSLFLHALFGHLLETNYADTLLRIDSPALEKWLRERKDMDLLCRYMDVQGKHDMAARIRYEQATDPSLKLSLSKRIEDLTRAENSYGTALNELPVGIPMTVRQELQTSAQEVSDRLQIARLQNHILRTVDSFRPEIDSEISPEKYEKLATTLVDVSELYNEYAGPLGFSDHCLRILHACRHDDAGTIQRLWKSVVSEEIFPCGTRNESTKRFLQNIDLGMSSDVYLLSPDEAAGDLLIFEEGKWTARLQAKVIELGTELYGTGADFVFPVDFLLFILQGLSEAAGDSVAPEWPLVTLADAGVPYMFILDAHESVFYRDDQMVNGTSISRTKKHIEAVVELLNYWFSQARSSSDKNVQQELVRAVASGRLMPKVDSLKAKLDAIQPSATDLAEQLRSIENAMQYFGHNYGF